MPQARLTLTVPEGVWVGDVSREFPDVEIRVLAAHAAEGVGVGHAELSGPALPEVVAAIDDRAAVTALEVLEHHEETALVRFETTDPLLLLAVQGAGVPIEMPFDVRGGEATWDVTAPRERLSSLADQLESFGVPYRVEQVYERTSLDPLLTDRQERLVRDAVEAGYYDTPRTCTLTELAEQADIAKSTCSETLHRAECRIVRDFLGVSE